jgi:hypothetical protein
MKIILSLQFADQVHADCYMTFQQKVLEVVYSNLEAYFRAVCHSS